VSPPIDGSALTVPYTAELLGLSEEEVQRLLDAGELERSWNVHRTLITLRSIYALAARRAAAESGSAPGHATSEQSPND
jgi:hypothetical protein